MKQRAELLGMKRFVECATVDPMASMLGLDSHDMSRQEFRPPVRTYQILPTVAANVRSGNKGGRI